MIRPSPKKLFAAALVTGMCLSFAARPAHACAVCFGDPNSPLVKGAASGVLVLGGITYAVLLAFAGVALSWTLRARKLRLRETESNLPTKLDQTR